ASVVKASCCRYERLHPLTTTGNGSVLVAVYIKKKWLPNRSVFERARIRGSPSAFHLPLTPSIEPLLIACASQTELNLSNQLVGVSGTALVSRLIVRTTDRRESHGRESHRIHNRKGNSHSTRRDNSRRDS